MRQIETHRWCVSLVTWEGMSWWGISSNENVGAT